MTAKRYSIRRRLLSRTMVCMLLILGGISLAAHMFARHESAEFFSARLASSARVLEALAAHQLETATLADAIEIPIPRQIGQSGGPSAYGHSYEHKIAFQIWSDDGRLLAKSASAPKVAFGPFSPGFSKKNLGNELWQVFALRSGHVWVLAAEKDEVREEMVSQLGASVLGPVLVGGVFLIIAVNLILSANLGPLRKLADGIARREPESLEPVELADMPDELAPVVNELNSLLLRVGSTFEREKQFIDAAAHEIRTPIAAVQLHVQNALRAGDKREREREHSLAEALVALKRTTLLAEQLLTFSRLASKTDLALHERVSLAAVCREVFELEEPLLERRGQSLGLDAPRDACIEGDPYRLQQLLRNLIDNASEHGLPGGDIDVAIVVEEEQVSLRVSNDGAPVPEDEVERIFEPYYRLEQGAASGAGLGLSIVREIANQHQARVSIGRNADNQGCVVTVVFPVSASPAVQAGMKKSPRKAEVR
jgi:two-component system sensor histidine kinase QseC